MTTCQNPQPDLDSICVDCGTSTYCGFAHGGDHDHSPEAQACTAIASKERN
jgi:hypothetical protein